jgi:hypothetical protein
MDNYNLASLCYKWIERYEKIVKERDQAIKERDKAFRSVERMRSSFDKVRCNFSMKEITNLRKHNAMLQRERGEARYWARKMMAERDEYKKLYDELWVRHNLCLDR